MLPLTLPDAMMSTPDGACLLFRQRDGRTAGLYGYHRKSLGTREAHMLDMPCEEGDDFVTFALSSDNVFGMRLNAEMVILELRRMVIRKETSELQLRSSSSHDKQTATNVTKNDCLLRCHQVMWTRFPVATAIERDNLAMDIRRGRRITLVSSEDSPNLAPKFSRYWKDMVNVSD
jgi:hypothetical protein